MSIFSVIFLLTSQNIICEKRYVILTSDNLISEIWNLDNVTKKKVNLGKKHEQHINRIDFKQLSSLTKCM